MRRLDIDPAQVTDQPLAGISPRVHQLVGEGKIVNAVKQLRDERPDLDLKTATSLVQSLR